MRGWGWVGRGGRVVGWGAMRDSRLTPVIRVVILVGVLAAMLGLAAAVGRPRLAATEVPMSAARTFATEDPNGLGGISVALPSKWRAETRVSNAVRGGVLLEAKENGSAPRPGTNLAPEGPRTLTIEVYPQTSVLPPRTFVEERLGIRQPVEWVKVGGHAGVLTGVAYNLSGRGEGSEELKSGWAFDLVAAATVPSGRVLVVRLQGPGRGSPGDARVLRRVVDSLRVLGAGDSAGGGGLGSDALDRLRSRPVTSPVGLLSEWAAGREGVGGVGPRLKQVAVVPLPGDVVTIEQFPVYLPAAPTDGEGGDLSEHPAVSAALAMAGAHDARLLSATVRRLSSTRLLLMAEPGGPRAPVAGLVVFADGAGVAPLAALLVARGQTGGGTDLARQLNRAADRLVFAPHSDDLVQLLVAGQQVAVGRAAEWGAEEILPLFAVGARVSSEDVPEVMVRIAADGTVDMRRAAPAPERMLRAERRGPGGTLTVMSMRQVNLSGTFGDVLSRQFTLPPRLETPAEGSPSVDLLSPSRYVRGNELIGRAWLAGARPALVVSDAVPPMDLDTEGLFSFVLIQPLGGGREQRRYALHVLGSGRVMVAEFDGRGGLVSYEEPGRLQTRREGRGGGRRGVEFWREEGVGG